MLELVNSNPQLTIPVTGAGTLTSTLPATTAGAKTVHADGLQRFITYRLYHGTDPIIELQGHCLKAWLELVGGRTEFETPFTAAAGNETGVWSFLIPRTLYDLLDPESSLEDLATGANSRVEFVLNGITAVTPTAGATIVSGTIDVDVVTQKRDPSVPLEQVLPVVKLEQSVLTDLVASTADQVRRFNPGYWVRRIIHIVEDNATTIARSNALVTNIQKIINQEKFGKESWTRLQAQNWMQRPIIGLTAPRAGIVWHYFDETATFNPNRMLNLTRSLQAEFGYDTAAAANGIRVFQVRELVLPGKQRAVAAAKTEARRRGAVVSRRARARAGAT
jgi:hypothetical protein